MYKDVYQKILQPIRYFSEAPSLDNGGIVLFTDYINAVLTYQKH